MPKPVEWTEARRKALSERMKSLYSSGKMTHWTKLPKNKAKLKRAAKKGHAGRTFQRVTKTLAVAVNGVNGHAAPSIEPPMQFATKLVRQDVATLAVEGAKHRLAALDKERELLVIFIQSQGKLTGTLTKIRDAENKRATYVAKR